MKGDEQKILFGCLLIMVFCRNSKVMKGDEPSRELVLQQRSRHVAQRSRRPEAQASKILNAVLASTLAVNYSSRNSPWEISYSLCETRVGAA